MRRLLLTLTALCATFLVGGCGGAGSDEGADSGSSGSARSTQRFPDVQKAELTRESDGSYTAAVTISSPYDTPERYADGWRVLDPDGTVLGTHELTHDHASEQPFTRTQSGLEIPDGVDRVRVEGRDQDNGYGGGTVTVDVP